MTWWSWWLGTVEFLVAWLVFDGPLRGKLWRRLLDELDELHSYQPGPVLVRPDPVSWMTPPPPYIGSGQVTAFGPMATQLRDHLRRYPEDREKLIARFGTAWIPPRPAPDFGGASNCLGTSIYRPPLTPLGITATETMWLQD
jgi:hypothetical protein